MELAVDGLAFRSTACLYAACTVDLLTLGPLAPVDLMSNNCCCRCWWWIGWLAGWLVFVVEATATPRTAPGGAPPSLPDRIEIWLALEPADQLSRTSPPAS
jgi:hypothetical protein